MIQVCAVCTMHIEQTYAFFQMLRSQIISVKCTIAKKTYVHCTTLFIFINSTIEWDFMDMSTGLCIIQPSYRTLII